MKTAKFEVVFTADDSWWQVRQDDFEIDGDSFDQDAFAFALENLEVTDNDESFACVLTAVDPEHTAIKAGDIVVSNGCGDDKVFIRRRVEFDDIPVRGNAIASHYRNKLRAEKRSPRKCHIAGCDAQSEIDGEDLAQLRALPLPGGGNAILCHGCYSAEIDWRKIRNGRIDPAAAMDLPAWENLTISRP